MPRPLRLEFPGAVYHLTARGDCEPLISRGRSGYVARYKYVVENNLHLFSRFDINGKVVLVTDAQRQGTEGQ